MALVYAYDVSFLIENINTVKNNAILLTSQGQIKQTDMRM
jgi:hypothetical protein